MKIIEESYSVDASDPGLIYILHSGQDSLKIFESGDEQAPIINLFNRRSDGSPHAGPYALMMSKPIAEKLLDELSALPPSGSDV